MNENGPSLDGLDTGKEIKRQPETETTHEESVDRFDGKIDSGGTSLDNLPSVEGTNGGEILRQTINETIKEDGAEIKGEGDNQRLEVGDSGTESDQIKIDGTSRGSQETTDGITRGGHQENGISQETQVGTKGIPGEENGGQQGKGPEGKNMKQEKDEGNPGDDPEVKESMKGDKFNEFFMKDGKEDPEKRQDVESLVQLALELGEDPYEFVKNNQNYLQNPDSMPSTTCQQETQDGKKDDGQGCSTRTQDYVRQHFASGGGASGGGGGGGAEKSTSCSDYKQLEGLCQKKTTPDQLISAAKEYNGTPYKWGGLSKQGIDCSGLVSKALADNGVFKEGFRTIADGFRKGLCETKQDPNQVEKGDLIFYKGQSKNGTDTTHVMIATGPAQGGKIPIIDASSGKGCVSERTITISAKVEVGKPKFY